MPTISAFCRALSDLDWRKPEFWEVYPEAKAASFARFLKLAESGTPKDGFKGQGKEAAKVRQP